MEDDEDLDDEHPDLPPEAGRDTPKGFEPKDNWLTAATPRLRREAMRIWFLSRYCDPVHDTPYNGAEGGYLFVNGGPYTAEDELYRRFGGGLSNDEEIRAVIDDVESEGIEEWAPIHHEREEEYDYDERFALIVNAGSEPLKRLRGRLRQAQEVLGLQGSAAAQGLARSLVFSSVIGALEAFLYETAYFWIDTDENALRDLVTGLPVFREEKIALGDLFVRHAGLKGHVKGYLQNLVWHRWDKVAPIFKHALGVQLPGTKEFQGPLLKRHDIVHRSGIDKSGTPVAVAIEEISDLCAKIEAFGQELDSRIKDRDPDLGFDPRSADAPVPKS
jgi:hypothetical protein